MHTTQKVLPKHFKKHFLSFDCTIMWYFVVQIKYIYLRLYYEKIWEKFNVYEEGCKPRGFVSETNLKGMIVCF